MPFSAALAARVRHALARQRGVAEQRMFGAAVFLLDGHLAVGVWHDSLIARLGPEEAGAALREPHVGPFDVTGRAMRGWVLVGPDGVGEDPDLARWVDRAVSFVRTLPPR